MAKGITFWTEGGEGIGLGHLMRSINIASMIQSFGIHVRFFVNNDRAVLTRLAATGIIYSVANFGDSVMPSSDDDIFVIDTKKDITEVIRRLRDGGKKTVVIDNPTAVDFADASIIPSVMVSPQSGKGAVYAGSRYIIIGRHFINTRSEMKKMSHVLPLKVLVTMGGADPFNLTDFVLNALASARNIEVNVVIGPSMKSGQTMTEAQRSSTTRIRHYTGVNDLSFLMSNSHIAFTAMGTTVYELAYMGVPPIIIGNYETDTEEIKKLAALGFCVGLGYYRDLIAADVREAVRSFTENRKHWETLSGAGTRLTDGLGALRIARIIADMGGFQTEERK